MMYSILRLRTRLLMLIFPCICPIFFLSILQIMKFLSKTFCKTVQVRVVIFGKPVDNDVLYRGIANQPHAYSSPCLLDFLSFHIWNNEFLYLRFEKMRGILVYICL